MLHNYFKRAVNYFRRVARINYDQKEVTIIKKNAAYITRLSKSGERIVFISSFPRSGNTWVRFLLSDCFLQNMGLKTKTKLLIHPDQIIPDRYCNAIEDCDASVKTPGLFIKTHDDFETATELGSSATQVNISHVFIYRCPEDTLVSYYHFHRRYEHLKSKTIDGVDSFCLAELDRWCYNIQSYIQAKEKDNNRVFFVSYEYLLSGPESIFRSLLTWLNISIDDSILHRAIANMQFKNLRTFEEQDPQNNDVFFFRRGKSGGGREELQTSTIEEIGKKTSVLLLKANSILAEQDAALEGNSIALHCR